MKTGVIVHEGGRVLLKPEHDEECPDTNSMFACPSYYGASGPGGWIIGTQYEDWYNEYYEWREAESVRLEISPELLEIKEGDRVWLLGKPYTVTYQNENSNEKPHPDIIKYPSGMRVEYEETNGVVTKIEPLK